MKMNSKIELTVFDLLNALDEVIGYNFDLHDAASAADKVLIQGKELEGNNSDLAVEILLEVEA